MTSALEGCDGEAKLVLDVPISNPRTPMMRMERRMEMGDELLNWKVCPLRMDESTSAILEKNGEPEYQAMEIGCLQSRCEWWDGELKMCCERAKSRRLKHLLNALDALITEIVELPASIKEIKFHKKID